MNTDSNIYSNIDSNNDSIADKIEQNNKRARTNAETAARLAKRSRQFGPGATCWRCNYQNVVGLVSPDAPTSSKLTNIMERHHVAGRHHDSALKTVVCRNCHAELTELLRSGGVPMQAQRSFPETLIACLEALALFFRELAEAFLRWADRIRTEGLSSETGRNNA